MVFYFPNQLELSFGFVKSTTFLTSITISILLLANTELLNSQKCKFDAFFSSSFFFFQSVYIVLPKQKPTEKSSCHCPPRCKLLRKVFLVLFVIRELLPFLPNTYSHFQLPSHTILRYLAATFPVAPNWYPSDSQSRLQVELYLDWQVLHSFLFSFFFLCFIKASFEHQKSLHGTIFP